MPSNRLSAKEIHGDATRITRGNWRRRKIKSWKGRSFMNSGSVLSDNSLPRGMQTEFRRSMESWRKLLKGCGRKPSRKSIHTLRVVTLRLQAAVEYWHNWQEPDAPLSDAVQRWSRQGKKLRCALGRVRQEDVSLDKLARVRSWSVADSGGHPALPKEYLSAMEQIEHRL